eukprot:14495288-Alexandrium_andersonii.AAC.1
MSASLVGSEMCIRDRPEAPRHATAGGSCVRPQQAPRGTGQHARVTAPYCGGPPRPNPVLPECA